LWLVQIRKTSAEGGALSRAIDYSLKVSVLAVPSIQSS